MNQISPEQLLSQIRTMSQALKAPAPPTPPVTAPTEGMSFASAMKSTLSSVSEAQKASSAMKIAHQQDPSSVSLAEVMVASEKAKLQFMAVTEVRNKMVTAYQDIMNMPV